MKNHHVTFAQSVSDIKQVVDWVCWDSEPVSKARYMLRAHNIGEHAVEAVRAFFAGKCFDEVQIYGKCKLETRLINWSLDDLDKYLEILEQGK